MKNFKSIFLIALSSLFLVACFGTNVEEPEASPEEVIKEGIKNLHYTKGGPYFKEYKDCGYSEIWFDHFKETTTIDI